MSPGGTGTPGTGLRAVIFDMDGVLIDTEPVWCRVEIEVFASLGVRFTAADCTETMGVRIDEVVRARRERSPWQGVSDSEVVERIVAGVAAHVSAEGEPMPGVVAAMRAVRQAGLRCAVASSSPPRLIDAVLRRLDLVSMVEVSCSAALEARGKPAPDVYLRAASRLELPPQGCLAIEDSVNGALAARAAGMPCLVIPAPANAADPRLGVASGRLNSLAELDAARLRSIAETYFE